MPVTLHAGFSTNKLGAIAATFTDAGGAAAISITYPGGYYSHVNITPVAGLAIKFATELQGELNASGTLSRTYTVTFNAATCRYTITANGVFSITGTSSGTSLASRILGFSADTGSSTSHSSNRDVWYSVPSLSAGRSNDSDVYEPSGIVEDAEADNGTHYATSRYSAPKYRDFDLQFNSVARTFIRGETSTAPYSLERLYAHTRGQEPIAFWDTDTSAGVVGYQRADGGSFAPVRMIPNNDLYWSWPFKIRQLGSISST